MCILMLIFLQCVQIIVSKKKQNSHIIILHKKISLLYSVKLEIHDSSDQIITI